MSNNSGEVSEGALGCLIVGGVSALILLLVIFFGTFVTIGVGAVGIIRHFGAIDVKNPEVFDPGFHFKMPFRDDVVVFNTRIVRANVDKLQAASKDGITVVTDLAVNYHIDARNAPVILQTIGASYDATVLAPAIVQAYKDVSGTFAALDMIQRRQDLADQAQKVLAAKVASYNIIIDSVSMTNIDFPESFDQALQATQVANQNRLKAAQDQEAAKIQAETARIQAEGLAAAQKAQAVSITEEYLRLQALQKWNGVLPQYLSPGAVLPFIGNSATTPVATPAPK